MDTTYTHRLEACIIDLMSGYRKWYEIEQMTGLSKGRCKEIESLHDVVLENYKKRNGV